MKNFWRNFGKQFFYEKFLANFRRTTSYPGDITAKSPKVRHRVAISGDFWQTLDTVFRRTKRFAASLPQTSPFAKGLQTCLNHDSSPLETDASYQRAAYFCTAGGWLAYIPERFKALAIWPPTHVYLPFGV